MRIPRSSIAIFSVTLVASLAAGAIYASAQSLDAPPEATAAATPSPASATPVNAPAPSSVPATVPPRPHVAVVGDSLIFTTQDELNAELAGRDVDFTIAANPGQALADQWTIDSLNAARGADVVVVATATNDNVDYALIADSGIGAPAFGQYATVIDETMSALNARCVVWVDVRDRVDPLYAAAWTGETNRTIREVVPARGGVVVPWSDISRAHDVNDWFVADETHFDFVVSKEGRRQAGADAYASAVAAGVDECLARL